jgi:DNA-(apurinic or apyrimidinic site) lyase
MQKLLKYLEQFSLKDAFAVEKSDRQFQALEYLFTKIQNKNKYLSLILANSTVSYLLSSSGEDYWEEFCTFFWENRKKQEKDMIDEIIKFLPISKWNKRLNTHKTSRLLKLSSFISTFQENISLFENDFILLRNTLAYHMKQKNDSKTIVYTIKMLSYGIRIVQNKDIVIPFEIEIPIDSRLTKIYELYNENKNLKIKDFYFQISKKTSIPPIHLDGILWTNYKEILTLE